MEISQELLERIAESKRVCVLTGAGISAESGVPTFRGGGHSAVWKGMPFDEISSAKMVRENLGEVWEWFDYRRGILAKCKPNPAHFALVELEKKAEDFTLVTQNVDGLHGRAGTKQIIELHGNINRSRCVKCEIRFKIESSVIPHQPEKCVKCTGELRPDVILFGEMLPGGAFEEAAENAMICDIFFVIGTSAMVYPAAGLAEIARQNHAYLVEINPEITPMTNLCDEAFAGKAGEILPLIVELF